MSVLGRGLASLIPKRFSDDSEDILEKIDSMEEVESLATETVLEVRTEKKPKIKNGEVSLRKKVSIVSEDSFEAVDEIPPVATNKKKLLVSADDFEELSGMEAEPLPPKPLVTPLQMDPETGVLRDPNEMPVKEVSEITAEILGLNDEEKTSQAEVETDKTTEPAVLATNKVDKLAEEILELDDDELHETDKEPDIETDTVEVEEIKEAPKPVTEKETENKVADSAEVAVEFKREPVSGARRVENEVWERHEDTVEMIPLGDINVNPHQPRRTFNPEELDELKQSIDQHGILQPLVVMRKGDGYELVAGERRLRAVKLLGWNKVPCVVRTDIYTDQSSLELALIENIQRQNLNPIEEAVGYKQLNEEYGMSHEEIGQRMGRSRVNITNVIRILQLPVEIQHGLIEGKLTVGHARAILMIPDEEKQIRFYRHLLDEGLTVRKAETRARRIQRQMNLNDPLRKKTRGRPQLAVKYDGMLEEKFGHTARVKFSEIKNRFEVNFYAFSEKEAEELIGRLLGTHEMAEYPEDE